MILDANGNKIIKPIARDEPKPLPWNKPEIEDLDTSWKAFILAILTMIILVGILVGVGIL